MGHGKKALISFVTKPVTARRLRRVARRRTAGNVSVILRRLVREFLREDLARRKVVVGPRQNLWDHLAVRYGYAPTVPPPPPYSCEIGGCLHPENNCELNGCIR